MYIIQKTCMKKGLGYDLCKIHKIEISTSNHKKMVMRDVTDSICESLGLQKRNKLIKISSGNGVQEIKEKLVISTGISIDQIREL